MFTVNINKVKYEFNFHYEDFSSANGSQKITHCQVFCDGKEFPGYHGTAFCHPNDKFVKHIGRKVALGNSLKLMGFDRDTRRKVWMEYLIHTKLPK